MTENQEPSKGALSQPNSKPSSPVRPLVIAAAILAIVWAYALTRANCTYSSWDSGYYYSTSNNDSGDAWPDGITRKGTVELRTTEFDQARAEIERILADRGAVEHWRSFDVNSSSRRALRLSATLRANHLAETMAQLRGLGTVLSESQHERDAAPLQSELRTEIAVARAAEARLQRILAGRPGNVPDAMVAQDRLEKLHDIIERNSALLEAFRSNRGTAFLHIELKHFPPREPEPTTGQLIARSARAGGEAFVGSAVGLTRFLLSAGPAGLFWTAIFFWPVRFLWRAWRAARQAAPSAFDA